jgi:hypothetical protein
VNLVGHVAVTVGRDPAVSSDYALGCALPDLAAMLRVRLERPGGDLGRGVACHHECDAVFHRSPWFRTGLHDVRAALTDRGVDLGPARACGHAGLEMLLDGVLVSDPLVAGAFDRVLIDLVEPADEVVLLAGRSDRARWRAGLSRVASGLDPRRYRDPRFVAERLHAMTRGRRRIELPAEQVDRVADVLGSRSPEIVRSAPAVLDDIRARLRTGPGPTVP